MEQPNNEFDLFQRACMSGMFSTFLSKPNKKEEPKLSPIELAFEERKLLRAALPYLYKYDTYKLSMYQTDELHARAMGREKFSSIQEVNYMFPGVNLCDLEGTIFCHNYFNQWVCLVYLIKNDLSVLYLGFVDFWVVDYLRYYDDPNLGLAQFDKYNVPTLKDIRKQFRDTFRNYEGY
jgi:hypothetical protein